MARIASVLFCVILISCASQKKINEEPLSIRMKENLYATQASIDNLLETNDSVFITLESSSCLKKWQTEVYKIKKSLRKTTKLEKRKAAWFKLGNCYNYVKDFKMALYYYDLVLGSGSNNKESLSTIYFNMGQIYEAKGQMELAYSYYNSSLSSGDKTHLSLLKLATMEYQQNEFLQSNKYLSKLQRFYPKSNLIKFLSGVNYFHLNKRGLLKNKVLKFMDEKSVGWILLRMAVDLETQKDKKSLEADLSNLDVEFKIHKDFKEYLLGKLGR